MTFTRPTANLKPISDSIFGMAKKAAEDKKSNPDLVVDATIGTLCGEDGRLAAYDSVFEHYDRIDHREKASYAASYAGNEDYRRAVYAWASQGASLHLPHSVIATPGGTGALAASIDTCLDPGETLILPDIAWGNYKLMAEQRGIRTSFYSMFDGDHFNLASVRARIAEVQEHQDRAVLIVNDPCHNPTGYSMTRQEWQELIAIVNEAARKTSVILINDTAYIDYSYDLAHCRSYMDTFNDLADNAMIIVAFSCSKTLTSYGLRCGAAIILAKSQEDVEAVENIFEKSARATWSNIPNAAMINFVWVTEHNRPAFMAEKQRYVDLMRERSSLFCKEAAACGLPLYPYKEGFFITIRIDDPKLAARVHHAFAEEHIYTILMNGGIRVACCSLPLAKVRGLAKHMRTIMDGIC